MAKKAVIDEEVIKTPVEEEVAEYIIEEVIEDAAEEVIETPVAIVSNDVVVHSHYGRRRDLCA